MVELSYPSALSSKEQYSATFLAATDHSIEFRVNTYDDTYGIKLAHNTCVPVLCEDFLNNG